MIVVKQVSREHSYILDDGKWLATVKNEHAEVIREAYDGIYSESANRTAQLQTQSNT